ncbi:alpha-glucuronidase [Polaribacter reichenbachii]|uniref:Xylan alpha-1,2-glucuronidase n=1 Tax=Polaribacter reichenbachii TaxID=996801 RepID=A0A1B8TP09_9FLAO|nr:alpha-glucuronidase family glycosyl hydrolase [Polaribacter reichenbachii]APZ46661.1 alpha-glucuronidase [Polaribacter reichenbachii]AUC17304.1 alpha-glucuronidase [Polaribacter reichenbachii]OBY61248.1 alpha-glucuronidase [Polaribacter reichenbachii]
MIKTFYKTLLICLFLSIHNICSANDGYKLWLQYNYIEDSDIRDNYLSHLNSVQYFGDSETINVIKEEISLAMKSLFGNDYLKNINKNGLIIGATSNLNTKILKKLKNEISNIQKDGFVIKQVKIGGIKQIVITAKTDIGVLYGTFNFLKRLQTHQSIDKINVIDFPKVDIRMLNHWDNLDRTVERGYSGFSIWDWHRLPNYIDTRYKDYARANASIGINGTALTNVNSNALILTPHYIEKVKAIADVFRPYGIKVYLTARFSAPIEIGNLETADPLDENVAKWWKDKTAEIYKEIPDFGGFLVKANSEGQPGPQNYGRNHIDGANMLADAVKPFNGIVMWRAFVYSEHDPDDRAKQAYSEFVPYDGQFRDNVLIQVKNGAIDFQPREPFHPMFGAMAKTNLMMEFQITQEYMGQGTHLVYQPKLYEEVLKADTYREGKGSFVAKVIDGSLHNKKITGIAGVANIGTDINWTGHHFLQANWYGFGRMAWNPYLKSSDIAEEWIKMTFTNEKAFVKPVKKMMVSSRETVVNYMTPYGLHHIMATGHHFGPGPWVDNLSRPEWNPVYYHKADENGVGFNRTNTGSNATAQYASAVKEIYNNIETTPEIYLLWFHHIPWDYKLKNGETLWNGLALKYQQGVNEVEEMKSTWNSLKKYIDPQRFKEISMMFDVQLNDAKWWRDSCLLYFQQFSKKPLPKGVEKSKITLEYFKSLKFPFAPGN